MSARQLLINFYPNPNQRGRAAFLARRKPMNKPTLATITPALAREMLKGNTHNLPVRPSHVDYLASEMASGRWRLTHQGIAFDGSVLVDGQNRLLGVVQSGVTIQAWVFGDVPLAVQELIDKGRVRSVADELHHFSRLGNAKHKTAACRMVLAICCHYQSVKMSSGRCRDVLDVLERDLDFVIAAMKGFRPGQLSWVHASLALALRADRNAAPFIAGVGGGENLKAGDPAKALRDWITNGGGLLLQASYKRAAVEGVFNAAYNAVMGNRLTVIKRGVQGADYFLGRNGGFVASIRDDLKHQIAPVLPVE
jgi:hypothetical protein